MDKRQLELSAYRLEKARDEVDAADLLLQNSKLSQAITRSYYAIFHATRALLALDEFDSKKHTGIIAFFNKNYVKPGKIEKEYSRMLMEAFDIRNESDYNDFYIAPREDAKNQLSNARKFLNRIQEYINNNK